VQQQQEMAQITGDYQQAPYLRDGVDVKRTPGMTVCQQGAVSCGFQVRVTLCMSGKRWTLVEGRRDPWKSLTRDRAGYEDLTEINWHGGMWQPCLDRWQLWLLFIARYPLSDLTPPWRGRFPGLNRYRPGWGTKLVVPF
jgi:hypothetical protein